jgi:hypothetical protein
VRGLSAVIGGKPPIFLDLRTDVSNYLQAVLPHEMCHLLVADRFRDRTAPLWSDEGLALSVDQPAKRQLYQNNLREGLRRRTAFRIPELLVVETLPAADRMGVFYGQCAALTHLLLNRGTPERLHHFVSILPTVDASAAQRATSDIEGATQVEEIWSERAAVSLIHPVASLLLSAPLSEQIEFQA